MLGLGIVEQFFVARTSPYRLGLVRIPIGVVGLFDALVTRREMATLFHPDALRVPQFAWLPELQAAHSDLYIGVWIFGSLLFTCGLFTRAAGTVVGLCIAYRLALDQTLYTTNIYLCGLITLLLVIGDAGAAISLDQQWRGKGKLSVVRWPETLLKLQISLVYFFTAIEKINPQILAGDAYERFMPVGFLDYAFVHHAVGGAIIAFELLLSVSLWSARLRGWAFLFGLGFHSAILVIIGFFGPLIAYSTMFVGAYFLFVDEAQGSRRVSGPALLLSWLRRLDWLRIHRYEPGPGPLSLATKQGQIVGWPAFRQALGVLPLTCLWVAVLDLPLVRKWAQAIYDRFSSADQRTVPESL